MGVVNGEAHLTDELDRLGQDDPLALSLEIVEKLAQIGPRDELHNDVQMVV